MAWAWRYNLSVDWLCAGWQENHIHVCRRQSGGPVARGCLEGGVLLPLLWCMVVDKLIRGIIENGCYREDITILTSGNFLHTISGLFQEALNMVQQWCDGTQVSISMHKNDDSTTHLEERFNGPEGTNFLWTHIAADFWGHIPWTISGQGIDAEGTADKCDERSVQGFLYL